MARRSRATSKGKAHRFGGDWTSTKLDVLARYLSAYTTALKDSPFRKAYIDAFAGTGYRTERIDLPDGATSEALLFPDLADAGPQQLLDGSARLALKVQPRFDRYIFIERDAERCRELEALKGEFPDLASTIRVGQGEANEEIQKLCAKDWTSHRAVLFLDPYGMQVEWQTIEAIARTKAIDLWLLFPLGIGVNRLLTRSGAIPRGWRTRLDKLLGTSNWYEEFYKVEHRATLFGNDEERVVKATNETIGRYFNDRLKTIFAGVADPGVLRNSANCPLYLLCFAAANEKGAPIALKIANHLLREVR
ncbi:MAG: three-Cys-motif partner protein TcmP [Myxococcales bacterium]